VISVWAVGRLAIVAIRMTSIDAGSVRWIDDECGVKGANQALNGCSWMGACGPCAPAHADRHPISVLHDRDRSATTACCTPYKTWALKSMSRAITCPCERDVHSIHWLGEVNFNNVVTSTNIAAEENIVSRNEGTRTNRKRVHAYRHTLSHSVTRVNHACQFRTQYESTAKQR
jgi:hypothetical protein